MLVKLSFEISFVIGIGVSKKSDEKQPAKIYSKPTSTTIYLM